MLHQGGRTWLDAALALPDTLRTTLNPNGDHVTTAADRTEYPNPEVSDGDFPRLWHRFRSAFLGEPERDDDRHIDFSGALIALQQGRHLTRDGWNGTGLFVMWQAGYPDGIPINANTSRATGLPQGTMCAVSPYLQLCKTGDTPRLDSWVPSAGDLLATDWRIVSRP